MSRPPRYRFGEPEVDAAISDLIDAVGGCDDADLVSELIVSALHLARDRADRGDLKIANAALREMRTAFRAFAPFTDRRKVAIFGSARTQPDDPLYAQARDTASAFAERDWMIITGAGPGIMEAGVEGAGPEQSFGVSIRLPFETVTSQFLAGDPKLVNFRYFFTRKLAFMKEAHGFVLLPGGVGTMDEAFELLTLTQTGKTEPAPIVMLDVPGGTYWQTFRDFLRTELETRGYIASHDFSLFRVTDDVAQAVEEVTSFYGNFHSIRFVEGTLVLRLRRAPESSRLAELSREFADIIVSGELERISTTPAEKADEDHVELERIAMRFDRSGWARLRQLIDVLNREWPATGEAGTTSAGRR